MIVLKLGGSVITRKDEDATVDEAALERTAAAIAKTDEPLVLVHGGGSFGHPAAARHGVSETEGTTDAGAVRDIHAAMSTLCDSVVDALGEAGVPAVPVHPLSLAYRTQADGLHLPAGQIETLLAEAFVPVLHGDVIGHSGAGATILSGDELTVRLAGSLGAARVGLCSTVPGVLDADGEVIRRIESVAEVEGVLSGSDSTDVTGGMAAKVQALADLSVPASIFGPDELHAYLAGETPGTTVV